MLVAFSGKVKLDDDETEYAPDTETVDEGDIQTGHDFIIEDSGIEIIDKDSAKQLSDEELRLAINEIYARHGRKFKSSDLQEYFDSKSWYEPKYEPDEFDKKQKTILSDVEIKNLETLTAIRKERGN